MAGHCGISCPVDGGYYSYSPSVAGNAILLAVFSLLVPVTLYMGYLFRTPLFSAAVATGILFDVVGFGRFLRGLEVATALLLAHSVYRVIEMAGGVEGGLFQSQSSFMVIDGAIPLAVCILLAVFHPGIAYGPSWDQTSPRQARKMVQLPLQEQPLTHRTHYAGVGVSRPAVKPTAKPQASEPATVIA
ncbi:RTA-like protein [Purpureocillium lavendulum]|uniref:RTA-like protein n=1 Tax=Purpureocillium lavendulum TaxID=1247861 RepID=A0AB34FYH2_9HYPO|nr:RTA-like protein [Purpureocillium lavendulum]